MVDSGATPLSQQSSSVSPYFQIPSVCVSIHVTVAALDMSASMAVSLHSQVAPIHKHVLDPSTSDRPGKWYTDTHTHSHAHTYTSYPFPRVR